MNKYKKLNLPKTYKGAKVRQCKPNEAINPILLSRGGEIDFEKHGIYGYLWPIKVIGPKGKIKVWQCPLVQSKKPGSGKFDEWLKSLKEFVEEVLKSQLVFSTVTNGHLYKYLHRHDIQIAANGILYKIKITNKK